MKRKIIFCFLAALLMTAANPFQGQFKYHPEIQTYMPAVEERPVLWKTWISGDSINVMQFISPNRLLVSYQIANPVLVDTTDGRVLWKFRPDGWTRGYSSIITGFSDLILIRGDGSKTTTLAAIDPENGGQLWYESFKNKKNSFLFVPLPAAEIVQAIELTAKKVTFTAFQLFTGRIQWKREFNVDKSGRPPLPVAKTSEIWCFYRGVQKIDAMTGETRWHRDDIVLDQYSPPPKIEENSLYLIDNKKVLSMLNAETGETVAASTLDQSVRYTNIFPLNQRIYVRGEEAEGSDEAMFKLVAIDKKGNEPLWSHTSQEPSVSNIIENDRSLYLSTPSTIYCLDMETGGQIYKSAASQTGRTFPVQLKMYDDKIVFIGEVIIAAFDRRSGSKVYSHGMTPVSQIDNLDALDNYISMLQQRVGRLKKAMWFGGSSGAANFFGRQAEMSQNLSNQYSRQARRYGSMSAQADQSRAFRLENQAQIESAYAGVYAQLSFFFSMRQLTDSMLSASIASDQSDIRNMQYSRRNIISAYSAGLSGDYVSRPHREEGFNGIFLIHLPTGKGKFVNLWPTVNGSYNYNERGIWHLIDTDNAVVYHHGMRILPEEFQRENSQDKAYGIHLIASPLTLFE